MTNRPVYIRAAAIVLHTNRILLHRANGDDFWALPGGRVEPGEDAKSAVVRELREELALDVSVERLIWVVENFFHHEKRQIHEVGLYFLVTPKAGSAIVEWQGPHVGREARLTFKWVSRSELNRMNIRPSFLATALAAEELRFEHIVHRDTHAL